MLLNDDSSQGSVRTFRIGSRSIGLYPLVIGCLGALNSILILTAVVIGIYCSNVSEVSVSQLEAAQTLILEVNHVQTMLKKAIKEREGAQQTLKEVQQTHQQQRVHYRQNTTLIDGLQRQLETLQKEKEALKSNTSQIQNSCGHCLPGWSLFNTSCYFHSKSASLIKKSWQDSREDCINRGADLVVINNSEEQLNLFEYLPKLSSESHWWSRLAGTWIGLSDHQGEGQWVWVNNVTQQNQGHWIDGEPNNYGGNEHCGAIVNNRNPLETWYDAQCESAMDWLCEKEPN